MRRSLLVVEDEPALALTLSDRLRAAGYEVDLAGDAQGGLERARQRLFDLVILDRMLPDGDGIEVCRRLRRCGAVMPILMLSARGQTRDRVAGLQQGADDYVVKPFEPEELLARIAALLRRALGRVGRTRYSFGDIEVDLLSSRVCRGDVPIHLSARLFDLLVCLLEHRGTVLSRDQLLDKVWGVDAMPTSRTVDVHVAWLRREIEPRPDRPRYLLTVRGKGYRLAD